MWDSVSLGVWEASGMGVWESGNLGVRESESSGVWESEIPGVWESSWGRLRSSEIAAYRRGFANLKTPAGLGFPPYGRRPACPW